MRLLFSSARFVLRQRNPYRDRECLGLLEDSEPFADIAR